MVDTRQTVRPNIQKIMAQKAGEEEEEEEEDTDDDDVEEKKKKTKKKKRHFIILYCNLLLGFQIINRATEGSNRGGIVFCLYYILL